MGVSVHLLGLWARGSVSASLHVLQFCVSEWFFTLQDFWNESIDELDFLVVNECTYELHQWVSGFSRFLLLVFLFIFLFLNSGGCRFGI